MRALKFFLLLICSLGFKTDLFFCFKEFKNDSKLELDCTLHDAYDCGEWGGHDEQIVIYKVNDEFKLSYKRDSNMCSQYDFLKKRKEFKGITNKEIILNKNKQNIIENYINRLSKHKSSLHIKSNAPNRYVIKYKNGNETKEIEIDDSDNSWRKHDALKRKLLE